MDAQIHGVMLPTSHSTATTQSSATRQALPVGEGRGRSRPKESRDVGVQAGRRLLDELRGMGQVGAAWIRYIGNNPGGPAFCVGTLGHTKPGKTVGLGRCANTSQQLFTGGTLGDKLVTVSPPF
jgi:hypothetical protein